MTLIGFLSKQFKVSTTIAKFILAGLGLFAAASIVLSFGSDLTDLSFVAIYLVIFATVATVFTMILNDGLDLHCGIRRLNRRTFAQPALLYPHADRAAKLV